MDDAVQGIVAVLQATALFVLPLAAWLLLRSATHPPPHHRVYSRPGWNFFLKLWWARLLLWMLRKQRRSKALGVGLDCVAARLNINTGPADTLLPTKLEERLEAPRDLTDQETEDSMWLWGGDAGSGAMVVLRLDRRWKRAVPDMSLLLRLPDGNTYTIPQEEHSVSVGQHPPPPVKHCICASRKIWSVRGLQLETLEPLRRWRIRFHGLLRRITDGTPPDEGNTNRDVIEPVSFSFMWTAASNPVELQSDWNHSLLAHALARESWRNGNWPTMADEWGDGYDQWGVMRGNVRVGKDDRAKTHDMYLRGLRRRRWGLRHARWVHRAVSVSAWAPGAGRRMTLLAMSSASASGTSHALWGHVQQEDGEQETVRETDLSLETLAEHPDAPPEHFVVRLQAGQRHYTLDVYPLLHCAERRLTGDGLLQLVAPFVCTFSNVQAQGVIDIWYRTEGVHLPPTIDENLLATENEVLEEEKENEEGEDSRKKEKKPDEPIVVFLEDERCRDEKLVGGKGASLAAMRALSHTQVRVPEGFCLTVHALECQLETSCALLESVRNVGRASIAAACNGDVTLLTLRNACERAEKMLKEMRMHVKVDSEVRSALKRLLNEEGIAEDIDVCLAVRSSALGEDSEELSAAGQNATLLGLRGVDAVIAAIRSCWASLYAFQSVAYRRQYGQPIECGMGVVVQVMVPAEKAGVLFTQHPVTASPNQMLITANYGLGETVVSAQAEPDSIVVARDLNGTLSITELNCGSKRVRIHMANDGGTRTEELGEKSDAAREPCLSHEEILRLAQLGLQIEVAFEGPRDIEWAIAKGEIYLLQSRPITSLDQWTDAELLHEFDSPITSDTDLNTFGNTGEVFPKICSPLGLSIVGPVLDRGTSSSMKVRPRIYCTRHLSFTHNRIMLNMHNTVFRALEEKLSTGFKVFEIAIFGHPVTTAEYHRYGLERRGPLGMKGRVLNVVEGLEASLKNKGIARKAQKLMESIQVHKTKYTSPDILHMAIAQSLKKVKMISDCHNSTSRVSVFSQIVTMSILTEGSTELTADHYSDIALLLSSCSDVVSADVPKDIKDLADTIVRTGRGQEFCTLPLHLAAEWLEANLQVSQKYNDFLQKHGHRGIQEFDVMTETWELKPQTIVGTLQTMVDASSGQTKTREPPLSPEDTVARLKTIKSEKVRSVLSLLLPWCRSTVARRELTKAALIGGIHRLRLSYRRLAHMLLCDGRLPDLQLIFFFTHFELGKYIITGSPLYIAKAMRRRRLWPTWEKLQFPEVVLGIPEPVNAMVRPPRTLDEGETPRLKGTPVWAGTVMGRACVIMQLSEISQLQRGDILITRGTDIGWSPYFPMLGGVVTELGGLISHGAVVAREYGLPCIVGAAGATDMFKTGDTVLLVGEYGTLEKLNS